MEQNGTVSAQGKTWPLYQREAFIVEVHGSINAGEFENAELLQREIHSRLAEFGLSVRVYSTLVLEMSPEDRAEKLALEESAVREYHGESTHVR